MSLPALTIYRPSPYTYRIQWQASEEHYHAFWEGVLFTKGKIRHFCNGVETELTAGQFMICRPTDVHYYKLDGVDETGHFPKGSKLCYEHRDIYMETADIDETAKALNQKDVIDYLLSLPHPYICNLDSVQMAMIEHKLNRLEFYSEDKKDVYKSIDKALIADILCIVLENKTFASSSYPKWLSQFLFDMNTTDIICGSLDNVVKLSNFSHGYLCKLYKDYTGQKLIDTFLKLKMQYASKLLMNTNKGVLEISNIVGYDSPANFINQFKKFAGMTPTLWRKKYIEKL